MGNLSCNGNEIELLQLIKTYTIVEGLNISLSDCRVISATISQLNLDKIHADNISLNNTNFISLQRSKAVEMNSKNISFSTMLKNSYFNNVSSPSSSMVFIKFSVMLEISNTNFTNISTQVIELDHSEINAINNVVFEKNQQCLYLKESSIDILYSSRFQNCNAQSVNGGALRLVNSNSRIDQTQFVNNSAESGGSISIECSSGFECRNLFNGLTFIRNVASVKGGAIYYNYKRPHLSEINYNNNSAQYGPEIASYAVKIVQKDTLSNKISLKNIGSNIKYEQHLDICLVDYDNQIMNLENSYMATILENDPNIEVKGTNSAKFVNGIATFDNIIFAGKTNMKNAMYQLVSRTINKNIINKVLDNSLGQYDNTIDVSFRSCKPGEIETSSKQ